jgi:hypothetical protein
VTLTKLDLRRITGICVVALCGLLLLAACGGDDNTSQPSAIAPTAPKAVSAATQPAGAPAGAINTSVPTSQVDACALLDQAEVEAALGQPVLPPTGELVANLACCSYGNPEAPIVSAAALCVFTGNDADYFAGAAAQTREIFEQFKSNAASAEPVSGLGEDAYWDEIFGTLHVLAGPYEVNLELMLDNEEKGAALAAAKALAAQALQRLPD